MNQAQSALCGVFVGNALAMPAHWYYNLDAMDRDFPQGVTDFLTPLQKHPDSHVYMPPELDKAHSIVGKVILKGKRSLWATRGASYHGGLAAGENTLNLNCLLIMLETRLAHGGTTHRRSLSLEGCRMMLSSQDSLPRYLEAYVELMTSEDGHKDTYADLFHRRFFQAYQRRDPGQPLSECAAENDDATACASGFILPLGTALATLQLKRHLPQEDLHRLVREEALAQMRVTHRSEKLERHWEGLLSLLLDVFACGDETVFRAKLSETLAKLGVKVEEVEGLEDRELVGGRIPNTCYVQNTLPAALALCHKYGADMRAALEANVHVGGDSAHRAPIIGDLIGAAFGETSVPSDLFKKLFAVERISRVIDKLA